MFAEQIERYIKSQLDFVLYNSQSADSALLSKYILKGEHSVAIDKNLSKTKFIGADLLNRKIPKISKADPLAYKRTLIRHNPVRLAELVIRILG